MEAVSQMQQALALDPLSILFRVHLGFLFTIQGQYEHSIAQFRARVLEMNPQYYLAHAMMGNVYTLAVGISMRPWLMFAWGARSGREQQICGFCSRR